MCEHALIEISSTILLFYQLFTWFFGIMRLCNYSWPGNDFFPCRRYRLARYRSWFIAGGKSGLLRLESPQARAVLWRKSADSARVSRAQHTIFSIAGLATVKVLPCKSRTAIFQNRCDDCVRPQLTHFTAGHCTGGRFPRSSHLRPSSARQPWKKVQFPNKCAD